MSNKGSIADLGSIINQGLDFASEAYGKYLDMASAGEVQERQAQEQIYNRQAEEKKIAGSVQRTQILGTGLAVLIVVAGAVLIKKMI